MEVLTTILYILLFIVFLSVLIMVHELGHLAAAKAFKVYCLEYSIGMGPLLFKYKRKNGETQFSLRGIPFGGYVSMYGEGVELPEGVEVPPERSLNNIKWWKRAIVLVAGVTMNSVLAITFFFISNCIPQQTYDYINQISIKESSVAYNAGLRSEDYIKFDNWQYYDAVPEKPVQRTYFLADNSTTFDGDDSTKYATCFNFSSLTLKNTDFASFTFIYEAKAAETLGSVYVATYEKTEEFTPAPVRFLLGKDGPETIDVVNGTWKMGDETLNIQDPYQGQYKIESIKKVSMDGQLIPDFSKYVTPAFNNANIHITKKVPGTGDQVVDGDVVSFNIQQKDGVISTFGCSLYLRTVQLNAGQAFVRSFRDFGESSVLLVRAIGDLFTKPSAWKDTGGIIAVAFETTGVLQNFGFAKFLYVWAFISVNLAVFNLLPFPGLDGWQLLVTFVEAATRKKIPDKVKNIVSLIGLGLLLLLMGALVVKDVARYFFMAVVL